MTERRTRARRSWLGVVGWLVLLAYPLGMYLSDAQRGFLFLPVLISLGMLWTFGRSLRGPMPLVERFARLQHPDLTDDERQHCRRTTQVWCVFFVLNAAMATGLALFGPLGWWAAYTGAIAYGIMGSLFAGEYLIRKSRFKRYGTALHDRFLRALLERSS